MKRQDYLSWDECFMGMAIMASLRSKDPSTQVGACIVDKMNRVISLGYNGAPKNYNDDTDMCWEREGSFLDTKYAYVCHSELNAILNANISMVDCKLYVTLFPCNECAKAIIQTGIKEIIYLSDKYNNTDGNIAAKKMFDACNIKYTQYKKTGRTLNIEL